MNEIHFIGIIIGMLIVGFIFDYDNVIRTIKTFRNKEKK
jgi:hypothetical protein